MQVYGEGNVPPYAEALDWIALSLVDQGKYAEALPLYQQMKPIYRGWYGAFSPKYASLLVSTGLATTDNSERERNYRQAIEIYDKIEGDDDAPLARALYSLAVHYVHGGRYAQAEELILRAMAMEESANGRDSLFLANNMQIDAAQIYRFQSKFAESEKLLKSLLTYHKTDPKRFAGSTLIVHAELSMLYQAQQKYDLAEAEIRQAIDLERKAFGETRLHCATLLTTLGVVQFRMTKHDEAAQTFQQSLAIASKLGGVKSLEAITAADSLGVVLRTQAQALNAAGNRAAARAKLQESLDKRWSCWANSTSAQCYRG